MFNFIDEKLLKILTKNDRIFEKSKDNERQPASLPGGDQVDGLPPAHILTHSERKQAQYYAGGRPSTWSPGKDSLVGAYYLYFSGIF